MGTAKPLAYFPHIDGLRAIAVLSVLVYHLHAAWLPGGFVGVDVFFVISGFIVSASVSNLDRCGPLRFMLLFYARRLQRIGPALMVCLLVTSVATALVIPPSWLSGAIPKTGLYAFFGMSNVILARFYNDYFAPLAEFNPYTHTWSLGVEEQFYLVFPLLFFAWTFGGRWRRLTLGLFGAALIASLGHAAWLGHSDKVHAFYMITSRFWQLAAGVMLFQAMRLAGRRFEVGVQPSPAWHTAGAAVSLALIGYSLATAQPDRFPYPGAIPAVLGAMGLLFFLHGKDEADPLMRVIAAPAALFIGRISYSLYLWHWPVFVLFRWTVGLDRPGDRISAVAIAVALAIASYFLVEQPVRRSGRLRRLPRPALVAAGFACIGLCAWSATRIDRARPWISLSTVVRNAADWYPEGVDTDPAYPGCAIGIDRAPVGAGWAATYARRGCATKPTAPRLFAMGDSHTLAYVPLYKQYALETGAAVTLYQIGDCPFLSMLPGREQSDRCRANARTAIDDMLTRIAPGDVVFLSSLRMPRFVDQYIVFPDEQATAQIFAASAVAAREQSIVDGEAALRGLNDKGAAIVVEAPEPIFRSPAYRCAEPYNRSIPICRPGSSMDRAELEALRRPILDALSRMAAAVPGAYVWDPFPILCPPGPACSQYAQGHPLFFDSDHLSGYANRLLAPSFRAFVASVGSLRQARRQ
jgi:peptidoglycan/LPS O-acetylase OafA/YrhL